MSTKTVQAWQLRPGSIVIPEQGSPRRVASSRLEGAHPAAVVEFAGIPQRVIYPATRRLVVGDQQ